MIMAIAHNKPEDLDKVAPQPEAPTKKLTQPKGSFVEDRWWQ